METTADLARRFWAKVEKTEDCWLWKGGVRPNGYGRLSVDNRGYSTHRLAWKLTNGPIPAGLEVLHRCDVRACVRPDHLFLGTQAENIADRDRKGRNLLGAKSPRARLTEAQALAIKSAVLRRGERRAFAQQMGVAPSTITAIRRGQNWRHLGGVA